MSSPKLTRRVFLGSMAATATLGGRAGAVDEQPRAALRRAAAYLWRQQADDGGWHSPQYGVLRSGQALTPFVLHALLAAAESTALRSGDGVDKALGFIRRHLDEHGVLGRADRDVVEYPVYSTAYAARCLVETGARGEDITRVFKMATFLAEAQFQQKNGFSESDLAFGGWGLDAPLGPGRSGHMDLAHTRRALDALSAVHHWNPTCLPFDDRPSMAARAERFLALVQKRPSEAARQPATADGAAPTAAAPPFDGGFYFSPVVLAANKGRVEPEPAPHWRSYATATCDGLLALLALGVPRSDERVTAAVEWLDRHTDVDYPQGVPTEHPEPWGDAIRFYHYSVRAETYLALEFPAEPRRRLAAAVARHQRADGSFVNAASPLMKEDDPVLCTALGVTALAKCL